MVGPLNNTSSSIVPFSRGPSTKDTAKKLARIQIELDPLISDSSLEIQKKVSTAYGAVSKNAVTSKSMARSMNRVGMNIGC